MSVGEKGEMILNTDSPWGSRPPSGNKPSGDRPSGNGSQPTDINDFLRRAQGKFKGPFGGGSSGMPRGKGDIGILIAIVLGLWLASGVYRVGPSEHAVILTFGKWTHTTTEPGLGYRLPWPVQEEKKVDVKLDRRVIVGYRSDAAWSGRSDANNVPFESGMLTGDENIINIDFVVLWHIGDAQRYLFGIRDPETTIKKVAESAMREVIGRTQIQNALTGARNDIEAQTRALMQKVLDKYDTGVVVTSVQLQKVDPPTAVVDAFDDVQRARSDMERTKNEAQTYANDIVPRARGEAQKTLQDAGAYKEAEVAKAEGDAQRFLSVYAAYEQSKDVTEKRLYLETMQAILKNSKRVVVGDGNAPVMPYLPLEQAASAK